MQGCACDAALGAYAPHIGLQQQALPLGEHADMLHSQEASRTRGKVLLLQLEVRSASVVGLRSGSSVRDGLPAI